MRRYELLVILNAEISEEDLDNVIERISQVIKKDGGDVSGVDKWGKRRLAYEIKRTKKGYYLLVQFIGETRLVKEIERNLRFTEGIIRYMTVALSEKIDPSLSRSYSAENREEAVL